MIIFNLGRKGGMSLYTKYVVENLQYPQDSCLLVNSSFGEHLPASKIPTISVPTYRNGGEFVLSTLFFLPLIFVLLMYCRLIKQHRKIYFPYIHFWTPLILIFSKILSMKSIVTIHDGELHMGDPFSYIASWSIKYGIKWADGHIFLSEFVKEQVYGNGKYENKPHFMSSLGTMAQDHQIIFERKSTPNSDKFLFFGRVSKYKGVELLLSAFNESELLKDRKLTIAGKSNYTVDYSNYDIDNLNVIDRYVTDEEIKSLFDDHDVLVMPYVEATQSGVLTYAYASNITVVMTNVGGLQEQVSEEAVYFCDANSKSLRDSLELVITDEKDRLNRFEKFSKITSSNTNLELVEKLSKYLFKS